MPRDINVLPEFERGELTFAPIPVFQYDKNLRDELDGGLGRPDALKILEYMLTIRNFEEMIIRLKNGKFEPLASYRFIGATHLSIGQEAVAIGAMSALRGDDYITSTHRGHGHSIAKGAYALENADVKFLMDFVNQDGDAADPRGLLDCAIQEHLNRTMAELFGKEEGYCRGRGGGMHIADFHSGHLGANAIVGGS